MSGARRPAGERAVPSGALWQRALALMLLLLATTQAVLSLFYVNVSYLDLTAYAAGRAPLPFQGRLLLVPFVRWAQGSALLQRGAERWMRNLPQPEPMTAAKLGCLLLGVLALNALGLLLWARSRRLGLRLGWLSWALLVVIVLASYAARFEQALWYPYDLPHLALFGAATLFVLTDEPWAFALCFAVDAFTRETAVFLLPVALAVHWRQRPWQAVTLGAAAVWAGARLLAWHLTAGLASKTNAVPWFRMAAPWHWPQVFSIVGFLWLPMLLARHALHRGERAALYAASACMGLTFFFATWNETRAWSEWSALFATLGALVLERSLAGAASGAGEAARPAGEELPDRSL